MELKRFLRRVPIPSLESYLSFRAVSDAIDWTAPPRRLIDTVADVLNRLRDDNRSIVWSDLERAAQFDGFGGRRAMRSVLSEYPDRLIEFDALEGVEACALYLAQRDPEAFDHAHSRFMATRLRNGRDWSGFEVEGKGGLVISTSKAALRNLARKLAPLFQRDRTEEPRLKIDWFRLAENDRFTGESVEQIQFTVYVEDPPQTVTVLDPKNEVARTTIRTLAEASIVIEPKTRTVDVVATGKKVRQDAAKVVVEEVISGGGKLKLRPRRKLKLDKLKADPAFAIGLEDRIRRVGVETLWLTAPDPGGGLVMIESKQTANGNSQDLYAAAANWFGRPGLPNKAGWHVTAAKLRIVFEPEGKAKREKSVAVELRHPDRTNLRDQTHHHRKIADTLLDRWGLYDRAAN
jgi:hypothetical protein